MNTTGQLDGTAVRRLGLGAVLLVSWLVATTATPVRAAPHQLRGAPQASSLGSASQQGRAVGQPVLARTAILTAVSGIVLVKLPTSARFTPLTGSTAIPFGSSVDAIGQGGVNGVVRVTTATATSGGTQSGLFYGGRFRLTQSPSGVTTMALTMPLRCPSSTARFLGAIASGRFTTKGRLAAASVVGTTRLTHWVTVDTCQATAINVAIAGSIRVDDFTQHRVVVVHAPGRYVAGT